MQIRSIESQTIDFLRLPLSIAVVFLHAYTNTQDVTWLTEGRPWYSSITYFFSLELGEIGVPAFFLIAGYLFFRNTNSLTWDDYKRKMISRGQSLLIPYLFWNLFFIVLFFLAEQVPFVAQYFSGANKPVSDYSGSDLLLAFWDKGSWQGGNGVPFDWPLWFVRNLFCLCLIAPLIKIYLKYTKVFGVGILMGIWYMTPGWAFLISSLFFFSLGSYLGMYPKSLLPSKKNVFYGVMLFYPLICIADFCLIGAPGHIFIHRIAFMTGIFFVIFLTAHCFEKGWFRGNKPYFGQLAFFIYAAHGPFINIVRKMTIKLFPQASEWLSICLYFAGIALVIGLIFVVFILLQKFFSRFLGVIVGR